MAQGRTGVNKSCLHIQKNIDLAPNEQFVNYMDYCVDEVSIMFSTQQALMMRTYLRSDDNYTINIYDNEIEVTNTTDNPKADKYGEIDITKPFAFSDEIDESGEIDEESPSVNSNSGYFNIVFILILLLLIFFSMCGYYTVKRELADADDYWNRRKKL